MMGKTERYEHDEKVGVLFYICQNSSKAFVQKTLILDCLFFTLCFSKFPSLTLNFRRLKFLKALVTLWLEYESWTCLILSVSTLALWIRYKLIWTLGRHYKTVSAVLLNQHCRFYKDIIEINSYYIDFFNKLGYRARSWSSELLYL